MKLNDPKIKNGDIVKVHGSTLEYIVEKQGDSHLRLFVLGEETPGCNMAVCFSDDWSVLHRPFGFQKAMEVLSEGGVVENIETHDKFFFKKGKFMVIGRNRQVYNVVHLDTSNFNAKYVESHL